MTIEEAVAAIGAGQVVVVPTDTVYGLAGDPSNPEAVERIFAIKGRPPQLELNLLAAGISQLETLVEMDGVARSLAAAFWPGPLSLVCPVGTRRLAIPRRGTTLMVRVPAHALLRGLLAETGPVASTSANRHGLPAAATAAAAEAVLGGDVAGTVDGGPGTGMASTIIDLSSRPPRVLREGPIASVALRPYVGGGTPARKREAGT
ncbi:MAG: L-threonylcarbamoyladenylate synthase [Candidatus Dormibacteria bacterium]|jgi:tRNA threonylcarbamoyl adenosine modification protein (Sua5/YciO/YrdC/YwlC family)